MWSNIDGAFFEATKEELASACLKKFNEREIVR
jgi:hypothetical protein